MWSGTHIPSSKDPIDRPQDNIISQAHHFIDTIMEDENWYTDALGDIVDNIIQYAKDKQQAQSWLTKLLHLHITLRYRPDAKALIFGGSQDTTHMIRDIPNYASKGDTTPFIELTTLAKSMAPFLDHPDVLIFIKSTRRLSYSDETAFITNTVSHSMRLLRVASQMVILNKRSQLTDSIIKLYPSSLEMNHIRDKIHELLSESLNTRSHLINSDIDNDPIGLEMNHIRDKINELLRESLNKRSQLIHSEIKYYPNSSEMNYIRNKISELLDGPSLIDHTRNQECQNYITKHISNGEDIDFYTTLLESGKFLEHSVQEARDFFGKDHSTWEKFWIAALIDPNLFLLALENSKLTTLSPLKKLTSLLCSMDDMQTHQDIKQATLINWTPIKQFHARHSKTELPCNSKLLSVLQTRFLAIFIPYFCNAKSLVSYAVASDHVNDVLHILSIMDREISLPLPLTSKNLEWYNNHRNISDIKIIPSIISFYFSMIKDMIVYAWNNIRSYIYPTDILTQTIIEQRGSNPIPSHDIYNSQLNGLIDDSTMKDVFDDANTLKETHHRLSNIT